MKERLLTDIREADMLLIGIGEEFEEKFNLSRIGREYQEYVSRIEQYEDGIENIQLPDPKLMEYLNPQKTLLKNCVKSDYIKNQKDNVSINAYMVLEELIKGKNYFIVSLCKDDYIYRTAIKKDRIVSPCGSYLMMQCSENCGEDIVDASDYIEEMMQLIKQNEIDKITFPTCKRCGEQMVFNNIHATKYNENGYKKQWEIYTKWLQGTLNKKVCILEMGVGVQNPTVIRWPFEKIAFLNQKASFYRINETLHQMPDEIAEKGNVIADNAVEYLTKKLCNK